VQYLKPQLCVWPLKYKDETKSCLYVRLMDISGNLYQKKH
jgi:hypothetical protein